MKTWVKGQGNSQDPEAGGSFSGKEVPPTDGVYHSNETGM